MEAANDALKLIAKSIDLLKSYTEAKDIRNLDMVEEAETLLQEAVDRLVV
jgi:hypothetical protein